jgi:hexosaminidase
MKNIRILSCIVVIITLILSSCKSKKSIPDTSILGLLPLPSCIEYTGKRFTLSSSAKIVITGNCDEGLQIADYLASEIKNYTGLSLKISQDSSLKKKNTIWLHLDEATGRNESYAMSVTNKQILMKSGSPAGLFFSAQTLLQLIYPYSTSLKRVTIPGVEIQDSPEFRWRGMHLDVSRHFFEISFIKKIIDLLAMHKMNMFHWHLTDDQGWRIEIKKYPKLTEISAWRDKTLIGHAGDKPVRFDSCRYGGYYTQEEIKEVVEYAKSRYITIVPEIEMPGHAVAALAGYPEYSCTGGPFSVWPMWGVTEDVFCAGKEETFRFLEDILDEVIALFPGEYIHIGGDECPKARWEKCPDCQRRIRTEGLKDEHELQSYFIKRIEKFLDSRGRKLIGWDEILEGGLPEGATVMSWRGIQGGIEAASTGHDVVMSPVDYCYFDYYPCKETENEPLAIGGYLPLDIVYSFNPVPGELSGDQCKHILGGQANLWSEYITTPEHAEYMIFPRLCAMAEVLWTPTEKHSYDDFLIRLDQHILRLKKQNVNYRDPDKFRSSVSASE